MPDQIVHVSTSDAATGASRAAYRVHRALLGEGINSRMRVARALTGDWTVDGPRRAIQKAVAALGPAMVRPLVSRLRTSSTSWHSPQLIGTGIAAELNASAADVVHLHWINDEMLSIAEIGRIRKPLAWTLHDMWAFCGAEHVAFDERFREGYLQGNRPDGESGFDLNRWTWERKKKHWKTPIHIVAPSAWLADCVRSSPLMENWPVTVIPNTLDTHCWSPVRKDTARDLLGIDPHVTLLLFGAVGGIRHFHKGFDLLAEALRHLKADRVDGIELGIFGEPEPKDPPDLGYPVRYFGQLFDDMSLRLLYSAADVMVVPSRRESFGQTALEAQACGTPVVAFNATGLIDVVDHQRTGYLAEPFDAESLAEGLRWVMAEQQSEHSMLGAQARERAVEHFDFSVVAPQYRAVYEQLGSWPGTSV